MQIEEVLAPGDDPTIAHHELDAAVHVQAAAAAQAAVVAQGDHAAVVVGKHFSQRSLERALRLPAVTAELSKYGVAASLQASERTATGSAAAML